LEAICLKAMSKRIEDRFPSMDSLAGALGEYLDRPAIVDRPRRRKRLTQPAVVGALLLGLVLYSVYYVVTDKGTLSLYDLTPAMKVRIDGQEVRIEKEKFDEASVIRSGLRLALSTGQHSLRITRGGRAAEVPESFEIRRGKTTDFRVEFTNPFLKSAKNRLGLWKEENEKDIEGAMADFQAAIKLDPEDPEIYCERGLAWSSKREWDKAIADYTEAIRLDSGDPRHHILRYYYALRGGAWDSKGEYDKAIADYDQVIRLDELQEIERQADGAPRSPWEERDSGGHRYRGEALRKKGEYDRAIANYEHAIRLFPEDAELYRSRAWIHATCPDPKYRDGRRAVELATKAYEIASFQKKEPKSSEPVDSSYLDTMAAAHAEAGDFEAAVQKQEEAIRSAKEGHYNKIIYGERLALYREKKPYREHPSPAAPPSKP
jgi:tetratricopeptide (TPR) repeat protein